MQLRHASWWKLHVLFLWFNSTVSNLGEIWCQAEEAVVSFESGSTADFSCCLWELFLATASGFLIMILHAYVCKAVLWLLLKALYTIHTELSKKTTSTKLSCWDIIHKRYMVIWYWKHQPEPSEVHEHEQRVQRVYHWWLISRALAVPE